jgi:hypothetical protein
MGVIYKMIFNNKKSYVTNRIDTQVTHPFLYPTRKENKKKKIKLFKKNYGLKLNKKSFLKNNKKNNILFLFSNQTFTFGCVTCVLIIGGFLIC